MPMGRCFPTRFPWSEIHPVAAPVPLPTRQALWQAHCQGTPPGELASRFRLAPRTVRHLLHSFRLAGGLPVAAVPPPGRPRADDDIVQHARALRRDHPGWGACVIRLRLAACKRWPDVPQPRTIQRWLAQAGLAPAPAGRRSPAVPRSVLPHERWQIDAKDQMTLANGQTASWLRVSDECSGAILGTFVFASLWNDTPASASQDRLRQCFRRWGMPTTLRLDNGYPWGTWNALPTALGLWVSGLGIALHYNDPRQPRQNGVVERSHGVSERWVEPATCQQAEELQGRVDEMDEMQRSAYPRQGESRMERYPELRHSGRPYSEPWEESHWDLVKAREYLAGHAASRRVSKKGQVGVYAKRYQVGRLNAEKQAWVQYDPQGNEWLFGDSNGVIWCRHGAEQITPQQIRSLRVSAKPPSGKDFCPD